MVSVMNKKYHVRCYEDDIAPLNVKQNCEMWEYDNSLDSPVYITSIHMRHIMATAIPIGVYFAISYSSAWLLGMRIGRSFLGEVSSNVLKLLFPYIVFQKNIPLSVHDIFYSFCGKDEILKETKFLNKAIHAVCKHEFISTWFGSYCEPKKDRELFVETGTSTSQDVESQILGEDGSDE